MKTFKTLNENFHLLDVPMLGTETNFRSLKFAILACCAEGLGTFKYVLGQYAFGSYHADAIKIISSSCADRDLGGSSGMICS